MLKLQLAWLWAATVSAFSTEYGLAGLPANGYDPICATACLRSFSTLTLSCSGEGITLGMVTFITSTECYAQNIPYLTSVAWCANEKCQETDPSAALMEYWWDMQITGQKSAGVFAVPAMWTYAQALAHATQPTVQLTSDDASLNITSLASENVYRAQYNVLFSTQREGTLSNIYGISMLLIGFGLPIVMTGLTYAPFLSGIADRIRPFFIWPSTIGTYHFRSLPYLIGKAPTIGQALFVALLLILNIFFTSISYESRQPNAWNPTVRSEILSYILGRTGVYAYILMPLVFLFAGRNNILLWMTNWSHSTYLLLHRWIARIFAIQVLVHSLVSLAKYLETGMYATEHSKPYWIWGIVATIMTVILCLGSSLYFRNSLYEAFQLLHIALSVILVVGCWYHAYDLYGLLGGYVYWVYATGAVWAFDRTVRIWRVLRSGIRHARVSEIGDDSDYVRVEIPGIRWSNKPGMHAYLYFPTVTPWRPWENHPFSVMPSVNLRPSLCGATSGRTIERSPGTIDSRESEEDSDVEKNHIMTTAAHALEEARREVGLKFFVKKSSGVTKALQAHDKLLTLIEGPYTNNSNDHILRCDRLLLIGGGIGITSLVPFLKSHWNVKLCWTVKAASRCLVEELGDVLNNVDDKDIRIGSRLEIGALIAKEVSDGWKRVGVVISGPAGLCDDARALVMAEAKRSTSTIFELEVEAYFL